MASGGCTKHLGLFSANVEQVMLIDPGRFKVINELLQMGGRGRGKLETLTFAATAEAD